MKYVWVVTEYYYEDGPQAAFTNSEDAEKYCDQRNDEDKGEFCVEMVEVMS